MNPNELLQYAQSEGERFWRDAGNHWLNDNFDLKSDSRVIEVGGYLGNWTDYVAQYYGCFVDVYEPVTEFYTHMVRRFSNRAKIQVFNYGVESCSGESHIAVMNEGSSCHNGGVANGPVIQVIDVAEIVRNLMEVDLLAINAEGAEFNILDRLTTTPQIANVRQILVQFHAFMADAESRRTAIRERLLLTHYETMCYGFTWESWRRK